MKAVLFTQYGSPEVLHLGDVEKPQPKARQVLIKLAAASINSWDLELLNGVPFVNRLMAGVTKPKRIKVLGCDVAGRVEAVGSKVTLFKPGDEVFGDLSHEGWGGFAEYVCAPQTALTLKPASLSFEQAAAIPQAGLLALQGLRDKGRVHSGQNVLINGASGGVGSFAVQIAKSVGAEVTGVCSANKVDFVRSLGADHVIDYTKEDFTENGQCYDLVFDVKGFHSIFDYKRALASRGVYVMAGGGSSSINQVMFLGPLISMVGSKKLGLLLHKANKGLNSMIELIESGAVTPVIDKVYPLNETVGAFKYYAAGNAKGKVVIKMA